MLTTLEFMNLWRDTGLRQYIVDEAKKRNRLPQLQEEYCQEAWMLISCAPAGCNVEAYKELAYRAIYFAWWQSKREYALMQSMQQHINAQMCKTRETPCGDEIDSYNSYVEELPGQNR